MSVGGIGAAVSAAQNVSETAKRSGSADTSCLFGSCLSEALSGIEGLSVGASYEKTCEYFEQVGRLYDSTGALMTALLICAGSGSTSPVAIMNLYSALADADQVSPTEASFSAQTASSGVTASPSVPVQPAVTSDESARSAECYASVIEQFEVETNPRYAVNQKGTGDTYCNIFVWDVTTSMDAEIPHYYNAKTGEPMEYGDAGASEMNANGIYNWLCEYGGEYGWREVSAQEAQELANQGHPVVSALYRSGSHGHVQVVCPSPDGGYDAEKGVTVAQAGSNLTSCKYITDLLGSSSLSKVSYFAHV